MKTLKIKIKNQEGLHARPASRLVSLCHDFNSDITIYSGDTKANGKNITEVLGLGADRGDKIVIDIEGDDESAAEGALKNMFRNNIPEMGKI